MDKTCKCGKIFYVPTYRIERKKFCSKACFYKYRTRPKGLKYNIKVINKGWIKKGQTFDRKSRPYFDKSIGYLKISIKGREIKYHRYKIEKKLGRRLRPDEIVHHKNENKLDNRLSNLKIMTQSEHMKLHHKLRKQNV